MLKVESTTVDYMRCLAAEQSATKEYRHDCLPFDEDRIVSFSHNYGPEYTAATLA
jgi:hypothetical protein